jgi:hypothetical protein
MNIPVRQEDIDAATPRNSGHCMVALAIFAATGAKAQHISVDISAIRYSDPVSDERYIWHTPESVRQALIRFDQGLPLKPFSFRLGRPIQVIPRWLGGQKRAPRPSRSAKTKMQGSFVQKRGGQAPPNAGLSNRGRRRIYGAKLLTI